MKARRPLLQPWDDLTPFGQTAVRTAALLCAVSLAAVALLAMVARSTGDAPSSAATPAPILPPAVLSALLLPPDEEAAGEVEHDVAPAGAEGEGGAGSSAHALSLTPVEPTAGVTLTPAEPGLWGPVLTGRQVYGLALYVSDDRAWAAFAEECFTGGGENRGYVGAVHRNEDGSLDSGIGQLNDRWHPQVDHERVRRDPVYAMQELYRVYQVSGAGAWLGCD